MNRREGLRALFVAHLPILTWWPAYDRSRLGKDALAGLVVAALVVPQSLGYAGIAGVPVQVGLYAIPLALLAYAVLGTSRQLFVGPVSTVSVLSGSLVANQAGGDPSLAITLTAGLAIASGLWLIAAGLLGVGWVAEFLSKPIVTGFVFGLTVVIIVGELASLLGVPPTSGNVFQRLGGLAPELDEVNTTTLLVGAVSLAVLFVGSRFAPKIPWGLVVLLGGVIISRLADLPGYGVAVVGDVPTGLPGVSLPGVPIDLIPSMIFGGAALALVGLAEGMSAARLFAQEGGYRIDSDKELVAYGASNVGAGLTGGMGVGGSLSKTAALVRAGGGSQMANLATGLIVVLALVTVVGQLAPLPRAVLSAIVIHAVWGLMDIPAIRRYRRVRRNDFVGCMVALGGVLLFGTLYGLLLAIMQSVIGLVYRSSKVDVDVMGRIEGEKAAWGSAGRHPERRTTDGILVLRLDAPIFWVNAADVRDGVLAAVDQAPGTHTLILDLESTNQLDTSSVDMMSALLEDLRARGIELYLVRVFHFVRRVLKRSGFEERLGADHMWHSISQGVREARARAATLDPALLGSTGEADDADADAPERIEVDYDPVEVALLAAIDEAEDDPLGPAPKEEHKKHNGNGKKGKKGKRGKKKHDAD